jgi:hypothetical protein
MLVRRRDLGHGPAVIGERGDVALPLSQSQVRVDRRTLQMGQLAGREPRRRATDQNATWIVHAMSLPRSVAVRLRTCDLFVPKPSPGNP